MQPLDELPTLTEVIVVCALLGALALAGLGLGAEWVQP